MYCCAAYSNHYGEFLIDSINYSQLIYFPSSPSAGDDNFVSTNQIDFVYTVIRKQVDANVDGLSMSVMYVGVMCIRVRC